MTPVHLLPHNPTTSNSRWSHTPPPNLALHKAHTRHQGPLSSTNKATTVHRKAGIMDNRKDPITRVGQGTRVVQGTILIIVEA